MGAKTGFQEPEADVRRQKYSRPKKGGDWSDNIVGRAFDLHVVDLGFDPHYPICALSIPGVIPEFRAMKKPRYCQFGKNK